jgi:hypothetical protein
MTIERGLPPLEGFDDPMTVKSYPRDKNAAGIRWSISYLSYSVSAHSPPLKRWASAEAEGQPQVKVRQSPMTIERGLPSLEGFDGL